MTLDEAIEMHERRIKFAQVCVCGDCPINECIKEHQLHIEWLKELKAYRDIIDTADERINNTYGAVIVEGYADVFNNLKEVRDGGKR